MKIENFEDIDARKEARTLTNEIYDLTTDGQFSKDYGLRDQIQRASVSIMVYPVESGSELTWELFHGVYPVE